MERHPFYRGKLDRSSTTACLATESDATSIIWIRRDCRSASGQSEHSPSCAGEGPQASRVLVGHEASPTDTALHGEQVAPERSNQRQTGRRAGHARRAAHLLLQGGAGAARLPRGGLRGTMQKGMAAQPGGEVARRRVPPSAFCSSAGMCADGGSHGPHGPGGGADRGPLRDQGSA